MKTKYKNFSLLLITIMIAGSAYAQKDKIVWSQEFKEDNGDKMGSILYDDGEYVYMYVQNKKRGDDGITPGIMKLDSKMNAVQRQDFKASEEDIMLVKIFYCGGKFIMLTSKKNMEGNSTKVYGSSISLPNLEASEGSTELWNVSTPSKLEVYLDITTSVDTTLFAMRASIEPKRVEKLKMFSISGFSGLKKDEKQKLAFKVLDSSFKQIQEKSKTLNYTEEQYNLKSTLLSNDGSLSFFAKQYKSTSKKETARDDNKEKQASYTLNILQFPQEGNEKEFNVELGNKLMDNMAIALDPVSSDLMMFVTYLDIDESSLIGYDFLRINSSATEIKVQKSHLFPQQLVDKMRKTDKPFIASKKGPYLPKTFNIHEMHVTADGRVYLILEQTFSETSSNSPIEYYAIGILAIMHDVEGNVKWNTYIPKRQWYRSTTAYLYQSVAYTENKISIFYNDHVNNQAFDVNNFTKAPESFNSLDEMLLISVEINNQGKAIRKVIQNSEKGGIPVKAYESVQGAGNRFVLYGETFRNKGYKIGVLKL